MVESKRADGVWGRLGCSKGICCSQSHWVVCRRVYLMARRLWHSGPLQRIAGWDRVWSATFTELRAETSESPGSQISGQILCTFLESLQECQCLRAVKHSKALILYAQSPAPLGPLLYLHKQPCLERYSVVHGCLPSKMLFAQNHLSSFLFPFLP